MPTNITIDQLNDRHALPGAAHFDSGQGRLPRLVLRAHNSAVHVYPHGAHVTSYQVADQPDVLFMNNRSAFKPGTPIRGGVPIVFPWFGAKADDPAAPMHGFARIEPWAVRSVRLLDDQAVEATFILEKKADESPAYPYAFEAVYQVTLGAALGLRLTVTHADGCGHDVMAFEAALHTYLHVGDVRRIRVVGLDGATYHDKVDVDERGRAKVKQQAGAIEFKGETDSVYTGSTATCVVDDPSLTRQIVVSKEGSNSTVVWNPWIDKAARMADFDDDRWPAMVCVETANVMDDRVLLGPGESHTTAARIQVCSTANVRKADAAEAS